MPFGILGTIWSFVSLHEVGARGRMGVSVQYYLRIVEKPTGPEPSGLYRKAFDHRVPCHERFNGFTGAWEYTTPMSDPIRTQVANLDSALRVKPLPWRV